MKFVVWSAFSALKNSHIRFQMSLPAWQTNPVCADSVQVWRAGRHAGRLERPEFPEIGARGILQVSCPAAHATPPLYSADLIDDK
jgi:hypothetical protein